MEDEIREAKRKVPMGLKISAGIIAVIMSCYCMVIAGYYTAGFIMGPVLGMESEGKMVMPDDPGYRDIKIRFDMDNLRFWEE